MEQGEFRDGETNEDREYRTDTERIVRGSRCPSLTLSPFDMMKLPTYCSCIDKEIPVLFR